MDRYVTDIKNGCYQNPVLPMDFSDPDAIRVGEDYYLISSSFTYLPGVPVLHSKDLVHWERIGNCVERLPFDRYAQPAHGCGTWAPALRYHAGRFYAFIPLPDEGILHRSHRPRRSLECAALRKIRQRVDRSLPPVGR